MLDFLSISEEDVQKQKIGESYISVVPSFRVVRSKDLMVRGGSMYAVWDEEVGLWQTSIYDLVAIVDKEIELYVSKMPSDRRAIARPAYLRIESNLKLSNFLRFCKNVDDNFEQLDQTIVFANDEPRRESYATMRLDYSIAEGSIASYTGMMSVLFSTIEIQKLEWAIGSVMSGESKNLQKFIAVYGPPGTGKSTYLNLIERLFQRYSAPFKANELGDSNRQFSMTAFKDSPLVAVDQDGSLAKIEDNTLLNSIVAHDVMLVNEKHKSQYAMRLRTFMFVGTNKQVKITDAYSGLIRRLIDVYVTGRLHDPVSYRRYEQGIHFELGAIAYHCLETFRRLGRDYYEDYVPTRMIYGTNALHNFVDHVRFDFESSDYITLNQAYTWYKAYMEDSNERHLLNRREFGEELKAYFTEFKQRDTSHVDRPRNAYVGFKTELFSIKELTEEVPAVVTPQLDTTSWLINDMLADCPAQYAGSTGKPTTKWDEVTTTLSELDPTRLHYVKPPVDHIVIDFDLTDENGVKSRAKNLEAIEQWPITYAEFSKSGSGIHLHYIYLGETERLSRVYSDQVEIKVFVGNASLRRISTLNNGLPVASLTSGLPLREEKVLNVKEIKTEVGLRRLVEKNLMKQVHPGTKPSIDFIHKILNDAYKTDLVFDLTDMKKSVTNFAMNSSNQSVYCLKLIQDMPFKSKGEASLQEFPDKDRVVIFDLEVYPNLFVICWKYEGDSNVVTMINPTPAEVEALFDLKLMGFYNRKYDNHILYARFMGYDNRRLYILSKQLINNERSPFIAAYNISYGDIYDYLSKKQSLKVWELELGLRHMELDLPWDEDVPDELIPLVVEYCTNDVLATEAVRDNRKADEIARKILCDLSGLPFNSSTNTHSARIIFGGDKNPHKQFVYTDLRETFPGYEFSFGKSSYRGVDPSEGGFVDSEPGMYSDVSLWDVVSMHPASIIALNLFGEKFTARFKELVDARIAIKRKDFSAASKMLDGKLAKYLSDPGLAKGLSDALKIVVNSVYGLTSAKFDNPFRDIRNVDNIVAKRGALFMIDLMLEARERGYQVVHIKTDSIKVANPDENFGPFVIEFGRKYGYEFEEDEESPYSKFCLVNDAVYVAQKKSGGWDAVGAQFKHPYVYKTMFSKEPVGFDDLVEVKSVRTSLSIDFEDHQQFVGRAGAFVPVLSGGGDLKRKNTVEGYSFATGSKGHKWTEAEVERSMSDGRLDNIDMSYFQGLVDKAYDQIGKYGDPEWLLQ